MRELSVERNQHLRGCARYTRGCWVIVSGPYDITGPNGWPDGRVDITDVAMVAKCFGQKVPPAPANCDVSGPTVGVPEGKIDISDVALVAKHFGEHYP